MRSLGRTLLALTCLLVVATACSSPTGIVIPDDEDIAPAFFLGYAVASG